MSPSKAEVIRALAALTAEDDHDLEGRTDVERELRQGLYHEEPPVRAASLEAAAALVHREVFAPSGALFERALTLSSDDDDDVRAESAVLLGVLPPQAAGARRLEGMLGDRAVIVRREAAAALGDWKDPATINALGEAIEDPDFDVRFEVAYALAQFRDARGLPVLVEALGSERHRVTACEGLRRLGHADAIPPLARMARGLFVGWPDRLTALGVLYALGEREAGERLVSRAKARNSQERAYALSLIGEHRITAGYELLETAAKDPKDRARSFAIKALGLLARHSDREFFFALARDEATEPEMRLEALRALAMFKGPEVDRVLEVLARHQDRRLAAEARRGIRRRTAQL